MDYTSAIAELLFGVGAAGSTVVSTVSLHTPGDVRLSLEGQPQREESAKGQ